MTELMRVRPASDHRILTIVAAATLLTMVAFTTVITTVTQTAAAFDAGLGWQTWALSAMSLGLAGGLLTAGSLADVLGHRRVFVVANLSLAAFAALAALAPSMPVFVLARVLQGAAGAGALAAGLGLLGRHFAPGPARTRATGVWGAALGAGIAVGPVLAAALSDTAGWRAASALTCAGGIVVALVGRGLDRPPASPRRRPLDPAGAALMTVAMSCLIAGLTTGRSGWASPITLALLGSGIVTLGGFAIVERRRAHPLLDLALLRQPAFLTSVGGAAVTGLATVALFSYMPVMLQRGLGQTALASGAVLAIWSTTSTLVAASAGRLPAAMGSAHRLLAGLLTTAAGMAGLAVLGPTTPWWAFAPGLAVAGVGSGLGNAALGRLAVESVPAQHAAVGSGANNTARYLGSAVGIAITVAVIAGGGPGTSGLFAGWNRAALLAAALNLAGAVLAGWLSWQARQRCVAGRGPGSPGGRSPRDGRGPR